MKTLTRLWSKLVRWECAWVEAQMFDDTVIMLMVQKPGWPVNMRIINHYLQGLYYTSQVVSRNYSIKDVLKVVLLYKHYLAIFLTVVICLFWFLWNFASGCRVAGCRQCGLTTTTTTKAKTYPWWWFTTDFLRTTSWVTLMWRFWYLRLWSQALQLLRRTRHPGFVGVTEWVKGGRSQVVLPSHPCSRHVSPCFFGILHQTTLLLGEGKSKKEESLAGMKNCHQRVIRLGLQNWSISCHCMLQSDWCGFWIDFQLKNARNGSRKPEIRKRPGDLWNEWDDCIL